jgi:hypothetical protein
MLFPETERLQEKSCFPCLVSPESALLLRPAVRVVELLDGRELFNLARGLREPRLYEGHP